MSVIATRGTMKLNELLQMFPEALLVLPAH